jgi:hypothetical protein
MVETIVSRSCLVIVLRSVFIRRSIGGRWVAYLVTRATESPSAPRWSKKCRVVWPFGSCFMLRRCLAKHCS